MTEEASYDGYANYASFKAIYERLIETRNSVERVRSSVDSHAWACRRVGLDTLMKKLDASVVDLGVVSDSLGKIAVSVVDEMGMKEEIET